MDKNTHQEESSEQPKLPWQKPEVALLPLKESLGGSGSGAEVTNLFS